MTRRFSLDVVPRTVEPYLLSPFSNGYEQLEQQIFLRHQVLKHCIGSLQKERIQVMQAEENRVQYLKEPKLICGVENGCQSVGISFYPPLHRCLDIHQSLDFVALRAILVVLFDLPSDRKRNRAFNLRRTQSSRYLKLRPLESISNIRDHADHRDGSDGQSTDATHPQFLRSSRYGAMTAHFRARVASW